ncbi:MAG: nicotinate (nicotinamide) nucleotide adenylyltransferase, partial [Acidobacteria bacterium]|nr:nicotinate (nicotinamide) nucleotide adenylyltransferase [Acidobacteriota bacterium]
MKVALFGGTFDPIHSGHLSAAQAALKSFALDRILFVPTGVPPHKRNRPLTPFAHRYAMVALACAEAPQFHPSLLEATAGPGGEPNYSIATVRQVAAVLSPQDRLYFLIGADAFLEIAEWHESSVLLDACDFIIVSRPGFSIREIEKVIPPEMYG